MSASTFVSGECDEMSRMTYLAGFRVHYLGARAAKANSKPVAAVATTSTRQPTTSAAAPINVTKPAQQLPPPPVQAPPQAPPQMRPQSSAASATSNQNRTSVEVLELQSRSLVQQREALDKEQQRVRERQDGLGRVRTTETEVDRRIGAEVQRLKQAALHANTRKQELAELSKAIQNATSDQSRRASEDRQSVCLPYRLLALPLFSYHRL